MEESAGMLSTSAPSHKHDMMPSHDHSDHGDHGDDSSSGHMMMMYVSNSSFYILSSRDSRCYTMTSGFG